MNDLPDEVVREAMAAIRQEMKTLAVSWTWFGYAIGLAFSALDDGKPNAATVMLLLAGFWGYVGTRIYQRRTDFSMLDEEEATDE